ncbi:MAG: hypothetical protein E7162_00260 [Firmicutes bacterium]|nr:hypothetical protein [Bacillota bacterium]
MLKRKGIFGLLLGLLLSVGVVFAAEALSEDAFTEKMEDLGYEVTSLFGYVTASDDDNEESYNYMKFDSADEAIEELASRYETAKKQKELFDEYDDEEKEGISFKLKCSNCEEDASGDTGFVEMYAKNSKEDEEIYAIAYRVEDTIIAATGENKADIVKTMKELGYYSGGSIMLYIIIAVVIVGAVGAALYYFTKKKGNNGGNNMPYGQPMNNYGQPMGAQPMGQNMGFNQPIGPQPMDQGMNNFNQPVGPQPMEQNMNFGQPVGPQPMEQNMNFGQPVGPQPMDQNMNNFGQPVGPQPTDPNFNNNQMNNNFPNMN